MFHIQEGATRQKCRVLAVVCGRGLDQKHEMPDDQTGYPFPEMVSSGRLEVQILTNPSTAGFCDTLESFRPDFVYLRGEQQQNDEEIGPLVWGGGDSLDDEAIAGIFATRLPTTVYLEIASGEKLAGVLHSKGIPYVIYWTNAFSCFAACNFRHALFSVVQSSSSHTWDAFQLAHASFRLYCGRNDLVLPHNSQKVNGKPLPQLLGDPPKIDVATPEIEEQYAEEYGKSSPGNLPAIQIHDDDLSIRLLVCGVPCQMDSCLLGFLEDGLNALLNIEIRCSKLQNRVSAPPPPLQAGVISRGVVTMRCDLTTCSSTYISLLVSGSPGTCFDDKILENHVKNEIVEKSQPAQALPDREGNNLPLSEPRRSASVACGASVFEVHMKVPAWASQVLRQLAPDASYRSFIALGIASIQGLPVASFEKDDVDRLLFFCRKQVNEISSNKFSMRSLPQWLRPPVPSKKSFERCPSRATIDKVDQGDNRTGFVNGVVPENAPVEKKLKVAAMRPVPRTRHHKMVPFSGKAEGDGLNRGQVKANMSIVSSIRYNSAGLAPVARRKTISSSVQAKKIISLNPLPLKKHGCGRSPVQYCSEEEFLEDVMQFLILRGHNRLVPQGGLAEFPDAILNAKRLDLYNLYREVASRGGFHVGNGINWKGQIFSKMRNYTATNRMTGVGNTLKRHYETYLLEYELAHDDVDGECCLLCHSAAGDWVNCGICGDWAHFGCDRRQGLGAFKDYAKTDGLDYVCPQCSNTNFKKKLQKIAHGFTQPLTYSRPV